MQKMELGLGTQPLALVQRIVVEKTRGEIQKPFKHCTVAMLLGA